MHRHVVRPAAAHFGVLTATTLATIGLLMLAAPLAGDPIRGRALLSLPLFVGLYVAARDLRRVAAAALAMVVASSLGVLAALRDEPYLLALDALLRAALVGLVAAWVIREVLRSQLVSLDTILGAVCSYLLIGYVYANVFSAIQALDPAAFRAGGEPLPALVGAGDPFRAIPAIFYFSYITLTTIAYGDVVPFAPLARFVATTEGMVGQLYPAIFIARLVSLSLVTRA